jgi:hypothetical protein
MGVVGYSARVLRPHLWADAIGKGFHVVVVFDVNAEPIGKTRSIAMAQADQPFVGCALLS